MDKRTDTVLQHHSLLTRSDCEVSTAAIDSDEVFDDSRLCVIAASDGEGAMGMLMAKANKSCFADILISTSSGCWLQPNLTAYLDRSDISTFSDSGLDTVCEAKRVVFLPKVPIGLW